MSLLSIYIFAGYFRKWRFETGQYVYCFTCERYYSGNGRIIRQKPLNIEYWKSRSTISIMTKSAARLHNKYAF